MLDATVVNVALPHIGEDFGVDVSALQWVLTGYLLALASLILLGGALGDRYGDGRSSSSARSGSPWRRCCAARRPVWVCSWPPGAAGGRGRAPHAREPRHPAGELPGEDRARAVGAWSGLGGVAGAIGPFVGGWLVDGPGWRWAFLINVPVAALAVACAAVAVPETRDPHAARGLDMLGAGLAVAGLGPRHGRSPRPARVVGPIRRCSSREDWPWWPSPPSSTACCTQAIRSCPRACSGAASSRWPTWRPWSCTRPSASRSSWSPTSCRWRAGWSALAAGTALLPATVLMLALSARSGEVAQRIGPRLQLTAGPLVLAVGLLLLARIGPDASWLPDVLPGAVLVGIGLVTFVAPLSATVMGSVSPDHVSVASGVNNAIARTASLASLALIPVISGLTSAVGPAEVSDAVSTSLVITAAIAAAAAPISFVGLAPGDRAARSARRRSARSTGRRSCRTRRNAPSHRRD